METTTIAIEGMACEGCVSSVTKALMALPGVGRVAVTLAPGQAVVEYDAAQVARAALVAAIEEAGFEAH
ncbi:MAG: cation transporter [Rhodocyclaceae bacterium]|nr:cation transporter [Rhodocyclaceae bacterium]